MRKCLLLLLVSLCAVGHAQDPAARGQQIIPDWFNFRSQWGFSGADLDRVVRDFREELQRDLTVTLQHGEVTIPFDMGLTGREYKSDCWEDEVRISVPALSERWVIELRWEDGSELFDNDVVDVFRNVILTVVLAPAQPRG